MNYEEDKYVPYAPAEMSVGSWIGTLILTCIPVVNIICMLVWAFGYNPDKKARKNWAIAQLIMVAIAIVLVVVLSSVVGFSILSMFN